MWEKYKDLSKLNFPDDTTVKDKSWPELDKLKSHMES
jgi:hypothetical protein